MVRRVGGGSILTSRPWCLREAVVEQRSGGGQRMGDGRGEMSGLDVNRAGRCISQHRDGDSGAFIQVNAPYR